MRRRSCWNCRNRSARAVKADVSLIEEMTRMMWWFVGGTVAFALAIMGFSSSLLPPLGHTADRVPGDISATASRGSEHDVASGRSDEIGDLKNSFDTFVREIRDTLTQVSQSSHAVAHASNEINLRTEDPWRRLQGTERAQASKVSTAVEEMARVVTANSKNASDTAATAHKAEETG